MRKKKILHGFGGSVLKLQKSSWKFAKEEGDYIKLHMCTIHLGSKLERVVSPELYTQKKAGTMKHNVSVEKQRDEQMACILLLQTDEQSTIFERIIS